MVAVGVVAAHDLASLSSPVGLVGMSGLRPGPGLPPQGAWCFSLYKIKGTSNNDDFVVGSSAAVA